ncbi:MAG: hypothetical protein GY857_14170 [Desulfobacula sp.]|nr:hypothetical protein [Desulfobacula sp.]
MHRLVYSINFSQKFSCLRMGLIAWRGSLPRRPGWDAGESLIAILYRLLMQRSG